VLQSRHIRDPSRSPGVPLQEHFEPSRYHKALPGSRAAGWIASRGMDRQAAPRVILALRPFAARVVCYS
jgi:hypothetical protein